MCERLFTTNNPVVASDNPDLWYSDPRNQHGFTSGYSSYMQSKLQREHFEKNLNKSDPLSILRNELKSIKVLGLKNE